MIKRILSISLMLLLLVGLFPVTTVQADSYRDYITDRDTVDGSHYTSSPALAEKLNSIFDGNANIYRDKSCTKPVDTFLGTSPVRNNGVPMYVGPTGSRAIEQGTSCFIYANGVYYTLFGETTQDGVAGENSEKLNIRSTGSRRASYENFKAWGVRQGVGALIRASGHSMILLDYDEESITYLDGNGDGRGLVSITNETWDEYFFSYVYYIIQPKDDHYASLYGCGMCGDDLFWSVDEGGTLTISGEGEISSHGWKNHGDSIKKVVIGEGVTGINASMFYNCENLEEIQFLGAAPDLAGSSFIGTSATVLYPATERGWHEDMLKRYGGDLTWEPYGTTELKIITQPQTSLARTVHAAEVSILAEGDGLTYTWYIKNVGEDLVVKSTVTGPVYSVVTGSGDQQVFCVVKDQYGNFVISESVLLRISNNTPDPLEI